MCQDDHGDLFRHAREEDTMPRAILKNGSICPTEPLPPDWTEGTELTVERSPETNGAARPTTDKWMDKVEELAREGDSSSDDQLIAALAEIRQQAKELARRGKM